MEDKNEEIRRQHIVREERARAAAREHELLKYREQLELQQREFDEYRRRVQEDQHSREAALRKEAEERETLFAERERRIVERQRDFERHLSQREKAAMLRDKLQHEVLDREAKLKEAIAALAQEKARYNEESRKKIERTSKDYVADALQTLAGKEREFHFNSKVWSVIGAVGLVAAIGYFAYLSFNTTAALPTPITWEFIAYAAFRGLFVVALLGGLAKYSFLFSRSYMQESLRNADRRHAINFGKFYLESYGAAADWSQVKEAFQDWNINSTNSFGQSDSGGLDFSTLEKAAGLIDRAGKAAPSALKTD